MRDGMSRNLSLYLSAGMGTLDERENGSNGAGIFFRHLLHLETKNRAETRESAREMADINFLNFRTRSVSVFRRRKCAERELPRVNSVKRCCLSMTLSLRK